MKKYEQIKAAKITQHLVKKKQEVYIEKKNQPGLASRRSVALGTWTAYQYFQKFMSYKVLLIFQAKYNFSVADLYKIKILADYTERRKFRSVECGGKSCIQTLNDKWNRTKQKKTPLEHAQLLINLKPIYRVW